MTDQKSLSSEDSPRKDGSINILRSSNGSYVQELLALVYVDVDDDFLALWTIGLDWASLVVCHTCRTYLSHLL